MKLSNLKEKSYYSKSAKLERKEKIMENTQKLRSTNVYIEHDMTVEERKIHRGLSQLAKEQKKKEVKQM